MNLRSTGLHKSTKNLQNTSRLKVTEISVMKSDVKGAIGDRHQRVHVRYADRARMAGKHQQLDLPSWYYSTFTNCTIKFSHQLMTHDVL